MSEKYIYVIKKIIRKLIRPCVRSMFVGIQYIVKRIIYLTSVTFE